MAVGDAGTKSGAGLQTRRKLWSGAQAPCGRPCDTLPAGAGREDPQGMMSAQELEGIVRGRAITDLASVVERLAAPDRERFDRLFHVSESTGVLVAPASMHRWIESFFGSVEA